ncbi:glycerol-3-phosphate dehydrogenase [Serendipita sp. 401]|nr:glycerol-3-phosphate dehydrogenase [Serendipita sp. 401]
MRNRAVIVADFGQHAFSTTARPLALSRSGRLFVPEYINSQRKSSTISFRHSRPTAVPNRFSGPLTSLAKNTRPKGQFHPKSNIASTAASFSTTMSSNASVNVIQGDSMQSERREKVAIIGSGNWGSAIASVAAKNALARPQQFQPEIVMWVFEEDYQGKPLSQVINETHMNPKYLPDIPLGENVIAEPDLAKALNGATALVIVFPHQFFHDILKQMAGKVEKCAKAVSLIKGVDVRGQTIRTYATIIREELGISCSSLSGANIATEVAQGKFSESTLGVPTPEGFDGDVDQVSDAQLWKPLFDTRTFRISVVPDVEGVGLCGALKNIVAVAAGLIDGLGWGSNSKAAIMRIGMNEVKDFCLEYFPTTKAATFLEESCGIADIITSSLGGRNRQVAEAMVKQGKRFHQLEIEMLKGQKLQGPETALHVHEFLEARGTQRPGGYPLFEAVWKICYENDTPANIIAKL